MRVLRKHKMEKRVIKCNGCEYCHEYRRVGNSRSEFICEHPEQGYIIDYFKEHKLSKMAGFIAFGKIGEVSIKTSPAWCPRKGIGETGAAPQRDMNKLVDEMAEHVCDELCCYPKQEGISQKELEDICAGCRMGEYACAILNEFGRLSRG